MVCAVSMAPRLCPPRLVWEEAGPQVSGAGPPAGQRRLFRRSWQPTGRLAEHRFRLGQGAALPGPSLWRRPQELGGGRGRWPGGSTLSPALGPQLPGRPGRGGAAGAPGEAGALSPARAELHARWASSPRGTGERPTQAHGPAVLAPQDRCWASPWAVAGAACGPSTGQGARPTPSSPFTEDTGGIGSLPPPLRLRGCPNQPRSGTQASWRPPGTQRGLPEGPCGQRSHRAPASGSRMSRELGPGPP